MVRRGLEVWVCWRDRLGLISRVRRASPCSGLNGRAEGVCLSDLSFGRVRPAVDWVRQSVLQDDSLLFPHHFGLSASTQVLSNTWVDAAVPPITTIIARERTIALRILNGHSDCVGNRRPGPTDRDDRHESRGPIASGLWCWGRQMVWYALSTGLDLLVDVEFAQPATRIGG